MESIDTVSEREVDDAGRGHVLLWPLLVALSMALYWGLVTLAGLSYELALQVQFLALCAGIYLIERAYPCHTLWNVYDKQAKNDFLYNVTFPLAQLVAASAAIWIVGREGQSSTTALFGIDAPFLVQLGLLAISIELIYYTYHRAFHTLSVLWKFHSIHHSSHQLHILNNARVHPMEVFIAFCPILIFVNLVQVPTELLHAYLSFQLTVGLLTHSNIAVNTGKLALVFNTPELHHWHHSKLREEQDNNYGSVLMLWDHVFGSYYNPRGRRASREIGTVTEVPVGFTRQLLFPFMPQRSGRPRSSDPG